MKKSIMTRYMRCTVLGVINSPHKLNSLVIGVFNVSFTHLQREIVPLQSCSRLKFD